MPGQQRKRLDLNYDVPLIMRLDLGPEGREVEGKKGLEFQYFVNNDEAVIWLPRAARDALKACGAQPGDRVQLCKSLHGNEPQYSAQVLGEQATMFSPTLAPAQPASRRAPTPARSTLATFALPRGARTEITAGSPEFEELATLCLEAAGRCNWTAWMNLRNEGIEAPPPCWSDIRSYAATMLMARLAR